MRAIRDDEEAAAVMGVDTFKWKRFVFAISAVFAATAGGFQGHYVGLLSPTPMKFNEMAMIVVMVIVGGLRTFSGPILGAVFIELLFECAARVGRSAHGALRPARDRHRPRLPGRARRNLSRDRPAPGGAHSGPGARPHAPAPVRLAAGVLQLT